MERETLDWRGESEWDVDTHLRCGNHGSLPEMEMYDSLVRLFQYIVRLRPDLLASWDLANKVYAHTKRTAYIPISKATQNHGQCCRVCAPFPDIATIHALLRWNPHLWD